MSPTPKTDPTPDVPPTEEPATNVVEALRRVMRDLPAIGKDQRAAREQGGYAYRGIEQITKEAQGLCARHGVIFVPRVVGVPEVVDISVNNKPWTDTRMLVEYDVLCATAPSADEGGQITVGPIFAIGRDNSDKGANKCMTQAFKYALLQTLMIADAKDDGDGTTAEADDYHPGEQGSPYRQATLRGDITSSDITRMRPAEVAARLTQAGLKASGTITEMRDRLTQHLLDTSSGDVNNAPDDTGAPSAAPTPDAPPTGPSGADSALPTDLACPGCRELVPVGEDTPLGREGVEDDLGRLWHAGCWAERGEASVIDKQGKVA